MPDLCAHTRWWALVYAGIPVDTADQQQPETVGAVTDADTVRQVDPSEKSGARSRLRRDLTRLHISLQPLRVAKTEAQ